MDFNLPVSRVLCMGQIAVFKNRLLCGAACNYLKTLKNFHKVRYGFDG
jgi:hypothetical protein